MRLLRTMLVGLACMGGAVVVQAQDAAPVTAAPAPTKPRMIRISTGVLQGQRLKSVSPVYPADARNQGIQGQVTLHIVVDKDGQIQSLDMVSGPEELQRAVLDAVKQWTYRPYILNGEPVAVESTVLVNFNLGPH